MQPIYLIHKISSHLSYFLIYCYILINYYRVELNRRSKVALARVAQVRARAIRVIQVLTSMKFYSIKYVHMLLCSIGDQENTKYMPATLKSLKSHM